MTRGGRPAPAGQPLNKIFMSLLEAVQLGERADLPPRPLTTACCSRSQPLSGHVLAVLGQQSP